jgi:uncharacterized membrane protein YdbT with pleckstrin-like domain
MLYVQQSLGPGEELVHIGKFHWMYTLDAFLNILWGIVGAVIVILAGIYVSKTFGYIRPDANWIDQVRALHPGIRIASFLVFIFGVLVFSKKMVAQATTEIAVTNARIIFKRGLIARYVGEINIDRIEGVNILQSIFGRIFNFGRLAVRGMGIGEVVLPPIADPIAFRQAIEKARSM